MFFDVAGFELRYQLRQPVFWAVSALFFLLTFGAIALEQLHVGDTANVHKNSPYAVTQTSIIMSVFYMFVTTAFVANVIVRDDETGYGPIIRATRLGKFDYLYGRFVGAFAAAALAFLVVPLGLIVGALMPWVDPASLGPLRLQDEVFAYVAFGLPNLFLTSALFFAVASVTRSTMGAYIGVIAFLILYTLARLFSAKPEYRDAVALIEPFGIGAFIKATRYWTASERNALLPAMEGYVLWNRLIWVGLSLLILAAAFRLFRFETPGLKGRQAKPAADAVEAAPVLVTGPLPRPTFDARSALAQLLARTRFDMALVFKSPVFLILMTLGLFNAGGGLLLSGEFYGTLPYPVTRLEIVGLRQSFTIIPILIAVFYAGELVWRDRDRKTNEIIDATAAPDWSFLLPKTLAIALVLVSTYAISVLAAVLLQTFKGYFHYELGHYLLWYILPETVEAFLLAALAIFLQSILPHKFLGWAAMLVYLIATIVAGALGFDDNLYLYAGTPEVPLSDMNGRGQFWVAQAWFQAYWGAFALILLVVAYGLWRRGTEVRLKPRLVHLPTKLRGAPSLVLGLAVLAFAGLGTFCFVNTHVLNEYRSSLDEDRRLADYEKTLLRFETLPQPTITDVTVHVEIHPHALEAAAHGVYALVNRTDGPIYEIHVRSDLDTEMRRIVIPGASPTKSWPRFHYAVFRLATPLAPGARTTLTFDTWRGQRGFKNTGYGVRVVDNGTFLNNAEITPLIGMSRDLLLTDPAKRRKYGLKPEQLRLPKLDPSPAARNKNYIFNAAWVNSDITVTTDADQTPIAPGYKISDVSQGGRRTARFRTEAPILNFFSVQSGRYVERHAAYKGVDVAVFYDPAHPWNVERMIHAAEGGLDYDQANFSPYQFRQYRSIEFPAYATFAQSFANTIPWSEALGFIGDMRDPKKIDYVTYVGDHELGHQWWGHQVVGAQMQGETSLSETLAQYAAMMAMEKLYGRDKIRRFLKYELDTYLSARGGERVEELPLIKSENQGYIHYNKGAVVMYLLKDQMGEERVNAALRRVIGAYGFKGPPYPTSLDLVAALRAEAPPDKQALITDLFEKITLWDVKATKVEVSRRGDGRYDVRLTVSARKLYADGRGKETPAPMTGESFDFGLFSAKPGVGAFGAGDVILFERRPLSSGVHVYDFVTAKKPTWAGVDPYNKHIDRNSDDNLIAAG
jgi:aminopeptidase N